MKHVNKLLIVLAIAVWLCPALSNAAISPLVVDQEASVSAHINLPNLNVVMAPQSSLASVNVFRPPVMATCAVPTAEDNISLNLNLPADCFSLSLGRAVSAQTKVAVTRFNSADVSVKVSTPTFRFIAYHLAPALPDASPSALPLPITGGLAVVALTILLSTAETSIKKIKSQFTPMLSLSQLQILRC